QWWLRKKNLGDDINIFACHANFGQGDYIFQSLGPHNANIGDIIQFHNQQDGWHHSVIIVQKLSNNFVVDYHNTDTCSGTYSKLLISDNNVITDFFV
ncbi:7800_t:CDS:2, partial [Gigaspora margarita]